MKKIRLGLNLNKVNFIEIKFSDFQVEKKWKKKEELMNYMYQGTSLVIYNFHIVR